MRLPRPDFLRPSRGVPIAAWILVLLAAAALAAASVRASQAWQLRDLALQEAARLPDRAAVPRPSPSREAAPMRELQRALEAPWRQRFEAVESATTAGVNWLSMDIGSSGELRLIGEAGDGAQPLEVVQRLRATGLWRTVMVSRSELGAVQGQRFEIRGLAAEAGP